MFLEIVKNGFSLHGNWSFIKRMTLWMFLCRNLRERGVVYDPMLFFVCLINENIVIEKHFNGVLLIAK